MTNKIFNLFKGELVIIACCSLAISLWPSVGFSQKYSFTNYGIEDGLKQSQVTFILQDNTHHLLITTLLGMNRFDGKTFTPIVKDGGLTDSVSAETVDRTGKVWCSTYKGLFYYYADNTTRFTADNHDTSIRASALVADHQDNIWGLRNQRLFKITAGHMENIHVTKANDTITAIAINNDGNILAAVYNKGIYCFKNNRWINTNPFALPKGIQITQLIAGNKPGDLVYVSDMAKVFSVSNNTIKPLNIDLRKNGVHKIYCITLDNANGLWIGTDKGAYYLNNRRQQYFGESNGFTDNAVRCLFKDFDNNIWFGTNGSGIFRFDGDSFLVFEHAQGITESISQLAKDKDNNILMTGGSQLMAYDGKKINQLTPPFFDPANNMYHCLYTDQEKNTWIVTTKGVWKKTGSNYTCFYPRNKTDAPISFNAMQRDQLKTIWVVTSDGCYYWANNNFVKIAGINGLSTGLIEVGRDSMFVSLPRIGVFLVRDKKIDKTFSAPYLNSTNAMCLKYYKGRIYIGTFADGLFVLDTHGRLIARLNEKNGLNSVSVYSIDIDKNGVFWVGTGRGVNQFRLKSDGSFQKIVNEDLSNLFIECNQDALLLDSNNVWIGATNRLFLFKNDLPPNPGTAPYTTIQDVLFYNKQAVDYTYKNGYKEPENLKLPFNNSHITLNFNGIYLKNPHNVLYSYELWPLDIHYCAPVSNNVVDYPSLPPGKYVFYVKSYSLAGMASNIASFSFEITPAYYQTALFKVAIIILLVLTGIMAWKYVRVKEERKRRLIAHLRLEEQIKIRKQTAEDFHDDLGNKLTRINVLSDILNKKIDAALPDQKKLIDQIKENADALFTGSKHILWALDPDNDRLSEVLIHIKEFGIDIFLNTAISFTSDLTDDVFKGVTLPMGYGRNITLILKELFTNALRHSGAKSVKASAFLNQDNNICITVEDDGNGFDMNTIKSGNGMRNINNRAKKMDGVIETKSLVGEGTSVTLIIKMNPNLYR